MNIKRSFNKQKIVIFPLFLILFIGCTAQRTFTNMDIKTGDLDFNKPYKLVMTAEYKENGTSYSKKSDEVLEYIEDAFSSVGFAKPSSKSSSEGSIHIMLNNKTSFAKSITKGFITGYTWGLIGYKVEDELTMDVEFTLNGETIKKSGYKHEIATIAGMFQEGKVSDKSELDKSRAWEKAAEQLVLKFLNDIQ